MGYVPPPMPYQTTVSRACAYCEYPITSETTDSRGRCRNCGASERIVTTVMIGELGLREFREIERLAPPPAPTKPAEVRR